MDESRYWFPHVFDAAGNKMREDNHFRRVWTLAYIREALTEKNREDKFSKINIIHVGFLPTRDDWYPNFINNRVFVYGFSTPTHTAVRISGADDFSMVRVCKDESEVISVVRSLPNPISQEWCKANCFSYG